MRMTKGFIFDPSLVLYLPLYKLDGASFRSEDAYGHLCTRIGALWRPTGYYLNGDDKLTIPDHPVFNFGTTGDLTLAFWFKHTPGSQAERVIYKSASGGVNPRFTMAFQATDGRLFAAITDAAGNGASLVGTLNASDGQWRLGLASFDRDDPAGAVLMLDTQIDVTADPTVVGDISTVGRSVYIGTKEASEYYGGDLGEIWIYARALSFVEKINLYLATEWRYR